MSGGHFDHSQFHISEFARQLQNEIDNNDKPVPDEDGDAYFDWGGYKFTPETLALLQRCQQVLAVAGEVAHHIDYLYSSDIGEDTFLKRVTPELDKL